MRTVGRDAEWKRKNTVGTSWWPQLMFMDTYEASCGLIQRYREDWSAGLADAGGGLRHQSPPVDASQHSRPHEGPSPRFHRAQCWPVLALPPDLIEHSSLDCVPVLSLSLKRPCMPLFTLLEPQRHYGNKPRLVYLDTKTYVALSHPVSQPDSLPTTNEPTRGLQMLE